MTRTFVKWYEGRDNEHFSVWKVGTHWSVRRGWRTLIRATYRHNSKSMCLTDSLDDAQCIAKALAECSLLTSGQ